jgi:hypothetical protein
MKVFIFVLVMALAGGRAMAFNPLIGEDSKFLGRYNRQLQGDLDYAVSENGGVHRYATTATARLSYGLWDKLDVLITVPWQGWSSKGLSESGLGDVLLEAKFQAARRGAWTLGLKPGFSLPEGDEAKSLGAGKGGVWLYGLAGKTSGPWEFYLNAGYLYNRNSFDERQNLLEGSAAASFGVLPGLRACSRLSSRTNKAKDTSSHPVYSAFGLSWSPYPTLDLAAGVRLGLNHGADDLGLLGGLTLRL